MKLKKPHVWIAAFSAGAVVGVALVDIRQAAPGPLALVHQQEIDLLDGKSCKQCHGGWTTSMTEACSECHASIVDQIEAGIGLHGVLGRDQAMRCAACHSDHHGPGFAIVNRRSFKLAGVPSVEDFDHGMIGFAMDGKHLELACAECHENADVELLEKGQQRYLGLEQRCESCHEDPHEGSLSALACAQCHAQESFEELGSQGHDRYLPLVGAHAAVSCDECHGPGDGLTLELMGAGHERPAPRTCMECHGSPHDPAFVTTVARMASTEVGKSCAACHVAEHDTFRSEGVTVTPAQHRAAGFPLEAPHDEVSCEACHVAELETFDERYPGREPLDCAACHDDPHAGQFGEGPFAGQGCVACHDTDRFDPHAFTEEKHALGAFELTGTHLSLDCAECHAMSAEGDDAFRVFRGTPVTCDECHADAHEGFFDERVAQEPLEAGSCAQCHLTTTFDDVPAERFDHGRWTGFGIEGAHAQEDCGVCHLERPEPDAHGRAFGRVEDRFEPYQGCESCHEDPHAGQFDLQRHPKQVEGRAGCLRCHVQTSFRSFPNGFDHNLWTGMALRGAHGEVGCARCHLPIPGAPAGSRTWAPAGGRQCSNCHANPHAGQFREADGETDCRSCHTSEESFSDLAFYHDRDSRFRLGQAHRDLECSACHDRWELGDGTSIVRYRPLPTDCVACHGAYEEELMQRWRQK